MNIQSFEDQVREKYGWGRHLIALYPGVTLGLILALLAAWLLDHLGVL